MDLKYSIDSWDRLTECKSNLSSEYRISVSNIDIGKYIKSLLIQVTHPNFGCLFAITLNVSGEIISNVIPDMSQEDILNNLKRFGFDVQFSNKINIDKSQLYRLRGLYDVGYSRIRRIIVDGDVDKGYIVAFKDCANLSDWYNNWYSPSNKELLDGLMLGIVLVISSTGCSNIGDWSWLNNTVYKLSDLLSINNDTLYSIDRRSLVNNSNCNPKLDVGTVCIGD